MQRSEEDQREREGSIREEGYALISPEEWEWELNWLERIKSLIGVQLVESEGQVARYQEKILVTNRNMWNDVLLPMGDFEEDFEMMIHTNQYLKERATQLLTYEMYTQAVKRLKRMYSTPYFGRIDFHEEGKGEREMLYIGIATLFDELENCLIYDWRAPISSMFYDFGPGPASYDCKEGTIHGEMFRKRQYRIVDSLLQFMFDTNVKIDDEILQQILSQNASGKMKQIVTSIQREQNRVIRDDDHDLLIVQGPAGSGKTSIALHRAAYLLYKYRNQIHSDNILIFSPNQLFSDYISNVLPELGEENMTQLTFQEFAETCLGGEWALEVIFDQLEFFYSTPMNSEVQTRADGVRFKSSQEYLHVIKTYITGLEQEYGLRLEPIVYLGETIVTEKELLRLWQEYRYLPLRKRLKKIRRRIFTMLKPYKKRRIKELEEQLLAQFKDPNFDWFKEAVILMRAELEPLHEILEQWVTFDVYDLYYQLFREPEIYRTVETALLPENWEEMARQTISVWNQGRILYEDIAPLILFKRALTGMPRMEGRIQHIFIDEAQDYSPFQFEMIRQFFPHCKLTVLGDVNQQLHADLGTADYRTIVDIFTLKSAAMIQLHKSYRSTQEIARFSQQILGLPQDQEMVNRSGEKPQLRMVTRDTVHEELIKGVQELQAKGAQSIAVICKTAAEAAELYRLLQKDVQFHLLTKEDYEFTRETVIIPSYLAKGLEFDAVIVYLNGENAYQPHERNLLYMVCTRALHDLHLYQVGSLSPTIAHIGGEYYTIINPESRADGDR